MTQEPAENLGHYRRRKERVMDQMRDAPAGTVLSKKTSNLFRERSPVRGGIDTSDFVHVISVDAKRRIADVEGMVTYETLVTETLKHGLVPAVVPELKSITVGGAFSGIGIETSSFRYGFVHETFLEAEVLLADGRAVVCSATQNADLFFGFPNSYGTIGYVLRAKLMLVPAKKYVRIVREKHEDTKRLLDEMSRIGLEQRSKKEWDFIEGVIFGEHENYLTLATFVDTAPYVSDYTFMRIYYKTIRTKQEDYLTTFDYLFRYDTDWFWASKYLGLENRLLRFLWGKRNLRSDVYYRVMRWEQRHRVAARWNDLLGKRTESLIQDVEVPSEKAAEFITWFHKNIGMKPFIAAPVMQFDTKARFPLFPMGQRQYMNIGFYAPLPTTKPDGHYLRLIEQKALRMKVKKMLYSRTLMTRDEFWTMFDKQAYDKLKRKYDPKGRFKDLYEKCAQR
jgi:FAD/FMN-containing dehydrogenase